MAGGRHAVGRGRQAGREHGLDRAGQPGKVRRRKARKIALEYQHVVGQEPTLRGRQDHALHRFEEVGDPAEMVARQEKHQAVVVLPAVDAYLLAQRQRERRAGGHLKDLSPTWMRSRCAC